MLLHKKVLRLLAASRAQRALDEEKHTRNKFLSTMCTARQLLLFLGLAPAVHCPVSCGQGVLHVEGDNAYLKKTAGRERLRVFYNLWFTADNVALCWLGWSWDSKPGSCRENYFSFDLLSFLSSWELAVLLVVAICDGLYSWSTCASQSCCTCCAFTLCGHFIPVSTHTSLEFNAYHEATGNMYESEVSSVWPLAMSSHMLLKKSGNGN